MKKNPTQLNYSCLNLAHLVRNTYNRISFYVLLVVSQYIDLTSSNVPQVEPENGHADLAVAIAVPIVLLLVVITLTTVLATIILFIILKRQRRNKSYSTGKCAAHKQPLVHVLLIEAQVSQAKGRFYFDLII